MKQEDYFTFLNLKLSDYSYINILGSENFTESLIQLNENIKKLLDEGIEVINTPEVKIPGKLIEVIDSNVTRINSIVKNISDLAEKWKSNVDQTERNKLLEQRRSINNSITDYIQEVYYQRDNQNKRIENNILAVLSLVKTFDWRIQSIVKEFGEKKTVIDNTILEFENKSKLFDSKLSDSEKILDDLRTEAAKKVVYDYANIFLEEAKNNSKFDSKEKLTKKFGSAEKWLFIGSLSLIFLIIFVIFMYDWFPTKSNGDYDISNIVTKLSLLGIIIFMIRFSFKQYSINKHLFTLNKHRENVLNSYQLFLSTVGEDDANIRNVLMLEVAKAIYEQGKTGYISEKDGDSGSPSIIEFTKLLTKDKTQ